MRRAGLNIGSGLCALLLTMAAACAEDKPSAADSIAEKFSQADAPKAAPDSPARPNVEYEMDMLRRARAEADGLKNDIQSKPAPAAAEPQAAAAAVPPAANAEPAALLETAPVKVEAQPTVATGAVTPAAPLSSATAAAEPVKAPAPIPPPPVGAPGATAQTTILIVLEGSDAKTPPDPIICFGETCAVSTGLTSAARVLPRAEALALKSTASETEDTCFGKAACAFRNVPLPKDSILQVLTVGAGANPKVDDGFTANPDDTCKMTDGDLDCGKPLATLRYTAWIVPEAVAEKAGALALEDAIAAGLPFADDVQAADK